MENFDAEGDNFEKEKLKILKFSKIFENLKIRDNSFVALLINVMSHETVDRSFKTAPVAAIPVNPYFWSKSVEYDVTLTSLTADLL